MAKTQTKQEKCRNAARAKDPEYDKKRALEEKQRRHASKKAKVEGAAGGPAAADGSNMPAPAPAAPLSSPVPPLPAAAQPTAVTVELDTAANDLAAGNAADAPEAPTTEASAEEPDADDTSMQPNVQALHDAAFALGHTTAQHDMAQQALAQACVAATECALARAEEYGIILLLQNLLANAHHLIHHRLLPLMVFDPEHTALQEAIHATAFHGDVAAESLDELRARL